MARSGQVTGQSRAREPVPLSVAWGELFGDPVVAAAILDRLLHRAVVINIKGPSWRLREHQGLVDRTRQGVGARV
jgi:IstB-like ATP binding protein